MELDFSFTLVTTASAKLSRKKKEKKDNNKSEIVSADSKCEKKTSTLSLARKKKYQNSIKQSKQDTCKDNIIKVGEKINVENKEAIINSIIDNKKIDCKNKLADDYVSSDDHSTKEIEEDLNNIKKELVEDKENISPVKKEDTLVMNYTANDSLQNKLVNTYENLSVRGSLTNSFSFNKRNKNSSGSSIDTPEYIELRKVSLRRHQLESYKRNIKNEKLYFFQKRRNIIKENSVLHNNSWSNSRDIFNPTSSSILTINNSDNCKTLKNLSVRTVEKISVLKENSTSTKVNSLKNDNTKFLSKNDSIGYSKRHSLRNSASEKLHSPLNNSKSSSINNISTPNSECKFKTCDDTPKGIKRSITVARNGFKKSSEAHLNSSESLCFRSCTKSKGRKILDLSSSVDNDDAAVCNDNGDGHFNSSFKSFDSDGSICINNETVNSITTNKGISLLKNNSRLSGIASLLSDDDNDDNLLNDLTFNKKLTDSEKSLLKYKDCNEDENKTKLTIIENTSDDIFNNSSFKSKSIKNNQLGPSLSCSDIKIKNTNSTQSSKLKKDKVKKNISLNSSMDFDTNSLKSSTPQPVIKRNSQCNHRKSIKNFIELNKDKEQNNIIKDTSFTDKSLNLPLSLPVPSYDSSPLLSKSKVKDITKWLKETDKSFKKNPFEISDSNNEEEISVSPPLINKRHKSSHLLNVKSEQKIIPDIKTPEPTDSVKRIRKVLTEPNKVNSVIKKKTRSVQKKRSVKKVDVSTDSEGDVDTPATRILYQLYGKSWRALNALPVTEPRNLKPKKIHISKPPMTERRTKQKSSMFSSSSSSEDHFEEFLAKSRLKRLELTKRRDENQLSTGNDRSFIDETLTDNDNSLTLYQKVISSDIKKDIDALSDSKWSNNSNGSNKSLKRHPKRLSFSSNSNEGSDVTNNINGNTNSKKLKKRNKKGKKKSPDKIIKTHIPINISHHYHSGSSGKKKKLSKKKIGDELKTNGNGDDHNFLKQKLIRTSVKSNTDKKTAIKPETPKSVVRNHSEQINTVNTSEKLQTPCSKTDVIFQPTPRLTLSFLSSLSVITANIRCHPDALQYKNNYKTKKEELSRKLFLLYNKEVFENKLPDDMLLQWNVRMRSTSGFCYNRRLFKTSGEVIRTSRIVLSSKILDSPDRLRDTLIHEMCHAATWIINGVSDGHGPRWKFWATKAMERFPELPTIKRCHDYDIKTKYTYRCTGCGYSFGRHSRSLDTERKRCGYCYGKFELLVNIKGKIEGNGRGGGTLASSTISDANVRTPKPVTGFALFVKNNYSEIKKTNNSLQHKDVMKLLGQKFAHFKLSQNNDKETSNE
ncbi:uncharacterized protein LOC142332540 isoform X1 [Lycorma delicatula]|uniref:uncharacterized protein LOC142332540 isoform X1 n=1 Tax=Lycorma delicatula TaxID=130591 RepID=UPI003F5100E8